MAKKQKRVKHKLTPEEKVRKRAYNKAVRSRKKKIRWENTKLRSSLFRIWFVKNLALFVQLTLMVVIILTLTGTISDPFEIRDKLEITDKGFVDIALSIGSVTISLLFGVGMVSRKLKSITLGDIKSVKTKKALLAAGLYFNEEGKLVKRIEKAINKDIDGDGKVGDVDIEEIPEEGILKGMKRAVEELGTVFTATIDEDEIPVDTAITEGEEVVKKEKKIKEANKKKEPIVVVEEPKKLTVEEKRRLARERLRNRR